MSRQPTADPSQVPETDEGDDEPPAAEKTPLDTGTRRRAKPSRAKPARRRVKEYEEEVPPEEGGEGAVHDGPGGYEDDSPLNTIAAVAQAMCEVSREGPGTGNGWVGRLFDHGDGRGPQPVYYGRIGSFPRTRQILERVQAEAGGGHFRFATAGQPTAFETLDGAPKLSPSEQEMLARRMAGVGGGGGLHDDRDFLGGMGGGAPHEQLRDPVQDFDPDQGIAPEDLARNQLNGWQLDGATGRLFFYANGIRSNPPPQQKRPPAHLIAAASAFAGNPGGGFGFGLGAFEPEAYFHGAGAKKVEGDPEIKELLKVLVTKIDTKPAVDPMASYIQMLTTNAEAEKSRRASEEAAAVRRAAEDKAAAERKATADEAERVRRATAESEERKARYDAEREERKQQFDLMIARLDREKATAETNQGNSVRIAEINAAAEKDKAAAAIASVEKMASIQASANQQVITAITGAANKGDQVAVFSKGMEIAASMMGGKGTVAELSQAARDIVPVLVDGAVAIKTMGSQSSNPSSGGGGQVSTGPSDDDMIGRFIALLIASFHKRVDPAIMPTVIGGACVASNYQIEKLDSILKIGTPGIVAAYLQAAADKAVDEGNKKKMLDAKNLISSPEGAAWFNQVKAALAAKGQAPSPPQLQGPAAPVVK